MPKLHQKENCVCQEPHVNQRLNVTPMPKRPELHYNFVNCCHVFIVDIKLQCNFMLLKLCKHITQQKTAKFSAFVQDLRGAT